MEDTHSSERDTHNMVVCFVVMHMQDTHSSERDTQHTSKEQHGGVFRCDAQDTHIVPNVQSDVIIRSVPRKLLPKSSGRTACLASYYPKAPAKELSRDVVHVDVVQALPGLDVESRFLLRLCCFSQLCRAALLKAFIVASSDAFFEL